MMRPREWRGSDEMKGQLIDIIVIGETLRANVEYFGMFGRGYMKGSNEEVAQIGGELAASARAAKRRLGRLLMGLKVRLGLKRYAWVVWRRDNSDLERFWEARFEKPYTELEERIKRLIVAAEPEEYAPMVWRLAVQRPILTPAKTGEERLRARVQRFKAALAKCVPVKLSAAKNLGEQGMFERAHQAYLDIEAGFLDYGRQLIAQLPEQEQSKEMSEIDRLFTKSGD